MKQFLLILILLSLLFATCEKNDGVMIDPISISLVEDKLSLINNTETELFYFISDQNALASIKWAPGVNEDQPSLAPRGQARIELNEIIGYSSESDTLVLYHWESIIQDLEKVPGKVSSIKFGLGS